MWLGEEARDLRSHETEHPEEKKQRGFDAADVPAGDGGVYGEVTVQIGVVLEQLVNSWSPRSRPNPQCGQVFYR